jgi:diguanylate cyclase (GGDEF)-like protein/PAS domain S-box-containing protein
VQELHDGGHRTGLPVEVLREALSRATQALLITGADGRIEFWNDAAAALSGYTSDEAAGQHLEMLLGSADEQGNPPQILDLVSPDKAFTGNLLIRHRDGRVFTIWGSISAVTDERGVPTHYIGVAVDLTESQAAARDTQMLASIVASSTDCILSADVGGYILWANQAAQDVLGWSPADLVGRHMSVLAPEGFREQQEVNSAKVLAGSSIKPYTGTRIKRDGTPFDAAVTLGPLRDASGEVVGMSTVMRDVTEVLQTQRELVRAMEQHRARFDQVAMAQAFVDLSGSFLAVNDALCELVGYSRDQLLGQKFDMLVHPMDSGQTAHDLAGLREEKVDSATYERIGRHHDGTPLPVLLDVTVLRDAEGERYAIAIFVQDLSEVREAQQRLASQESLFRALNRRSSDASVVTDSQLNIVHVSPAVLEVFGYAPDYVLQLAGWDFVHPDDFAEVAPLVEAVVAEADRSERTTVRIKDAVGKWRVVELTLTNCLTDPDILGLVVNLRDVTEQVEAQRSLRESESRYRAIVGTAQEGILALAPDGRTLMANEKMAELAGVPLSTIYESETLTALPPTMAARLGGKLRAPDLVGPEKYEIIYPHPDGTERIFSVSSSPFTTEHDGLLGVLNMVSDVTLARRTEKRLRWQALHDPLTGLPNRALLVDRLEMAIERESRDETSGIAVLFLDLDQFKLVNDSRGHQTGDRLLKEAAGRLETAVRRTDTVARLGGDEFAVVCEDTDEAAAVEVANRIRDALNAPFHIDGEPLYVGASIGVALSPPHSPTALLRFADAAMYKAKSSGGSNVVVFDSTLASGSERKLAVSNALREALSEERIALSYQPIVALSTEEVIGVEALLQWTHPVLGEIPSREVVNAADQSGLSFALDRLVIRTACAEFAILRQEGVLDAAAYVSVNISARTLSRSLGELVHDALDEADLPAGCLTLEITENTVMDDPERAAETLRDLQERGVSIAIDDFGTGYSSLAHLQRLPLNVLKIDRSFVETTGEPGSLAIVRSIVALAKAIGLRTTAEGIETREQAQAMRDIGCDAGQGFLWDAAIPGASLSDAVAKHRR